MSQSPSSSCEGIAWIGPTTPSVPTTAISPAGISTGLVDPLAVTTPSTTAIVVDPSSTSNAYPVPWTHAVAVGVSISKRLWASARSATRW
jgi:hypothetical protein